MSVTRGRRPTVLHVTTTDMSLEWLLGPQLTAFREAGWQVLTASAPGPHVSQLRDRGLEHIPIPSFTRSVDARSDLRSMHELAAVLRRVRPDILHTHNPKPGVLGRGLGRMLHVPGVVNTVHGLWSQPGDRRRKRWPVLAAERLAAGCSDIELVQNIDDLETLRRLGVPRDRLIHLGNGVDLERFDPLRLGDDVRRAVRHELGFTSETVVITIVARLVAEKGWNEFFEAVSALTARHGRTIGVVAVGASQDDKADGLDLGGRTLDRTGIRFVGQRDDPERILAASDLFVLPSWREGMPRAAIEASAMGLPVIATDIRGCRHVVDHGRTGLLVPVRNASMLTEAIDVFVTDPDRRRRYGVAGRLRARRCFDQRRVIATTLAAYRQLLDAPTSRSPRVEASRRYVDSIDLVAADASNCDAEVAAV